MCARVHHAYACTSLPAFVSYPLCRFGGNAYLILGSASTLIMVHSSLSTSSDFDLLLAMLVFQGLAYTVRHKQSLFPRFIKPLFFLCVRFDLIMLCVCISCVPVAIIHFFLSYFENSMKQGLRVCSVAERPGNGAAAPDGHCLRPHDLAAEHGPCDLPLDCGRHPQQRRGVRHGGGLLCGKQNHLLCCALYAKDIVANCTPLITRSPLSQLSGIE